MFRHSLSGAFADVSLNGRNLTVQNAELLQPRDAAGDVGTQGVAPKAWIRENGSFYLLKNGDERDVKAELLASKIARCFRVESVPYEPSTFAGKPVSRSRIITSEDESLVSMEAVDVYCANHSLDRDAFVLKKDAYGYHMMNLIDYLVGNTDRHWGNWGFLVHSDTNKLEKLHPLMDFNKSFLSYDSLDGARCQTRARMLSQREAALEAVRAEGLNQIAEVKPESGSVFPAALRCGRGRIKITVCKRHPGICCVQWFPDVRSIRSSLYATSCRPCRTGPGRC